MKELLAKITKTENGHLVEFKRTLKHPPERVWAMLTVNEKLSTWFSELRIEGLREGGEISFDMGDGTFEKMNILELKPLSVLEYTWGNDRVRFELTPMADGGTLLTLKEFIGEVNAHTPRDLAGWDVCLDAIEALLDGRDFGARKDAWEPKYEAFKRALGN